MNRWFGEPWPRADYRASVCADDKLRIPVPVGETCYMCDTPIVETDRGQEMFGIGADGKAEGPLYGHIECFMRNVSGCFELVSTGKVWTPDHVCHGQENYHEDALKVWAWIQTHPSR
jgi:hypothetical protein